LQDEEAPAERRAVPVRLVPDARDPAGSGRGLPRLLAPLSVVGFRLFFLLFPLLHRAEEHLLPVRARALGFARAAPRDLEADGLGKSRERIEALRDGEGLALGLAPLLRCDPVSLHLLDFPVRQERAGVELPRRRARRAR